MHDMSTFDDTETLDSTTTYYDDTIAAIATPPGIGGVGIVRISGPDAFTIGQCHLSAPPARSPTIRHPRTCSPTGTPLTPPPASRSTRCWRPSCARRAPTRARMSSRLQAHGGPLVLQRILAAALAAGARAARPGEMTLRAFLNGRLDLAQAEAVHGAHHRRRPTRDAGWRCGNSAATSRRVSSGRATPRRARWCASRPASTSPKTRCRRPTQPSWRR